MYRVGAFHESCNLFPALTVNGKNALKCKLEVGQLDRCDTIRYFIE